jgi:pimeloyl-ACP methyl ester carboxylesterase
MGRYDTYSARTGRVDPCRETRYQRLGGHQKDKTVTPISKQTVDFVNGVAAEAQRIETPCGDGGMVWRVWGSVRQPTALKRLPDGAAEADALAVARHNLAALMIADPAKIDELAVYIQSQNAPRGRVKSRRFSRTDTLARALPLVKARLNGIWGERDATAYPHLDERARVLRSIQPSARFQVIPGGGHWVLYEAAEAFNPLLTNLMGAELMTGIILMASARACVRW